MKNLYREIPSVDELLRCDELKRAVSLYSAPFVAEAARIVLSGVRREIKNGVRGTVDRVEIATAVALSVGEATRANFRRVINATGTILHTNLGRAVLSDDAALNVLLAAKGEVNLEYDLKGARRGERDSHVEGLIKDFTGAEAACVVNNNAAAVLLALNTLAEGREVVISRGELIEIGGSFRLPEIIEKSGCRLKEVGTTNRTHVSDYTDAVGADTALFLKVHTSNYQVVGFASGVSIPELSRIAAEKGLPLVEDLGSGSLVDLAAFGLGARLREPVVRESVKAGADIVTFSGDKLLGGPQAGIIAGKREFVDRIRRNPLKRALRVDKLTIAALESTLRLYRNLDLLPEKLPALRYLTRSIDDVEETAVKASLLLRDLLGSDYRVEVVSGVSQTGSGSLPADELPTKLISISNSFIKAEAVFAIFLESDPPVLGRICNDLFLLDMRTIEDPQMVIPNLST